MTSISDSFNHLVLSHWADLSKITSGPRAVVLNGRCLRLANVIAVQRYGLYAELSDNAISGICASARAIDQSIADGETIYGVNTGFGGSADTRTQKIENLQREIMRGLNYGILDGQPHQKLARTTDNGDLPGADSTCVLPFDHQISNTHMPEAWVRGTMLIRLNSLARGASGVRPTTIETLFKLLEENIIPLTPIRGSISASGDLSPLSYIGSMMQGKPTSFVWAGKDRKVTRADWALAEKSIPKVRLGPKEGLAIVNGTAASTSVGALAMHEVMGQTALAQVLTAMSVEALLGTDESFDPFFSDVRPHPGQRESASAILSFLKGSLLVQHGDGSEISSLRQDRYSIRTVPQWLGPVLEDLVLAHRQVTDELNSATDNPLIDTSGDRHRTIHGGNFQARAITSAMEKIRQGVQSIGRMLFTQCTELINPATNFGLPPNLVFDEPSESYIWKGTDIMIAALTSELGFLANPVGTHVQTAEMGNQALNSLALISARYTLEALQVLTQLSSAHLVALCQALDLRAMSARFLEELEPRFHQLFASTFLPRYFISESTFETVRNKSVKCWAIFTKRLAQLSTANSKDRFLAAISTTSAHLITQLTPNNPDCLAALQSWTTEATDLSIKSYDATKDTYFRNPNAAPFLGAAAKRMYAFVRNELGIPFIRNDTISTPPPESEEENFGFSESKMTNGMTIGDVIAEVYRAQRSGSLYSVVIQCLEEADAGKLNVK